MREHIIPIIPISFKPSNFFPLTSIPLGGLCPSGNEGTGGELREGALPYPVVRDCLAAVLAFVVVTDVDAVDVAYSADGFHLEQ